MDVLDTLIDPFRQGIGQRALVELVVLGVVCGPLGVWIVLFRQSYAAESIAHSMLPGLVLAAIVGAPLGLGAAAGLALAALLIALASRQVQVGPDVAVAVTVTTLFGAGALLALSPAAPLRLGELLFGDPLSVDSTDLIASGALALLSLGVLAAGHRSLLVVGFDPPTAASLGSSTRRVGILLLLLLALTTLVAVQALGNLLVVAIVIAPAAAALRIGVRLVPTLAVAAAIAIGSGVAGIYMSFYAEVATGASIAICAIAAFVLTLPFGSSTASIEGGSPVEALGSGA